MNMTNLTLNNRPAGLSAVADVQASVTARITAAVDNKRALIACFRRLKLPNTYATWRRVKVVYNREQDQQHYVLDYGQATQQVLL